MGNHPEKQDSADTGKTLYDIYSMAYCVLGSYPFGEVHHSPESARCQNAVVYVLYPDDIYPYVCSPKTTACPQLHPYCMSLLF